MHVLQNKHTKLSQEEAKKVLGQFNVALAQLPKISKKDPALGDGFNTGDVVKIERKGDVNEIYYRVVI